MNQNSPFVSETPAKSFRNTGLFHYALTLGYVLAYTAFCGMRDLIKR